MAIDPSNTVTYGQLTNNILSWIQNICENVGSEYKSSVDEALKPNTIFSEYSGTKEIYWEYRYNYGGDRKPHKFDYYKTTYTYTLSVNNDTVIPLVTTAQIKTDFDNFMTQANLIQRKDYIVTTSGLLNLWNNIICFLYAHLFDVTSNFANKSSLMYWSNSGISYDYDATDMTDMNTTVSETKIAALDINEMLSTLQEAYNPVHRSHIVEVIGKANDSTDSLGTGTTSRTTSTAPQGTPAGIGTSSDYQGCTDLHNATPRARF